jgi:glycosyltransferase involved in cell wall biosynthesis
MSEAISEEPLVTIGCAVYNGEETLGRALASVCGQDYARLEILIGDDCSIDGSPEIYDEVARRDGRVRIIRNVTNIGVTRNFNTLFQEAKGKYFMWADQDDVRDTTFVRKTVAALEAAPAAVLCHSHTGLFIGDPTNLKQIATLNKVSGALSTVTRYRRFLTNYSDTAIYSLIRSDALRRTRLWRHGVGSSNSLLFELSLLGQFIQVPEVLYFYSGRGLPSRPSPREEYERANPGKQMPLYHLPFAALAINQIVDVFRSPVGMPEKAALFFILWGHIWGVVLIKLFYRILFRVCFGHVPELITRVCESIVDTNGDVVFVNGDHRDEEVFPKSWVLLGRR